MYIIKVDGKTMYSPLLQGDEYQVISPQLQLELNTTGSLSFTLPPEHVLRYGIRKMISIITVEQDGEEIFRGRAMEERTDIDNQASYHCEGELSFLLDSMQRPYTFSGTVKQFLTQMINSHNDQVDTSKRFVLGAIANADSKLKTESKDYKDTLSEIETILLDTYGGHLISRYEDGTRFLDYEGYSTGGGSSAPAQKIEFGVNLLDIDNQLNAQEIYTVLIPLGEKQRDGKALTIASVNNGRDYLENADAIAQHGRIVKTFSWAGESDPQRLLELGQQQLTKGAKATTLTLTAIDMHLLDVDEDSIRLGGLVQLISVPHGLDKTEICSAISIDIENPEKSTYTFGTAEETFSRSVTRELQRHSSSIGRNYSHIRETEFTLEANITVLNEIEGRVSSAEFTMDGLRAEIGLKVSMDGVISAINMSPEEITISSKKINLAGYVTASQLEAEIAEINRLFTGAAVISFAKFDAIQIDETHINAIKWHNININGTTYSLLGAPLP